MSLIHWWPLTGTAKDMMGAGPDVNTPSYVNGKIGKALDGGSITGTAQQWNDWMSSGSISIAMWAKVDATGSYSYGTPFFGNGSSGKRRFALFSYSGSSDDMTRRTALHYSWMHDELTNYNTYVSGTIEGFFEKDVWIHLCVTQDAATGVVRIYKNGTMVKEHTGLQISDKTFTTSESAYFRPNYSYMKVNDLRLYNHALSKKEVQELARALVFHYTFDGGVGEETTNLLPVSLQNKYVENVADAASYTITSGLGASSYTLFANIRCGTNDNSPTPYFSLFADYSDGTSERLTTSTSLDGTSLTTAKDNQFHPYQLTIDNPQRKTVTKLYGWLLDRGSYSGQARYMTVQNAQLEAKDHATAFTSSTRAGQPKNNTGLIHGTMENKGVVFCKDAQRHSVGYFKTGGQQLVYTGLSGYESALTTSMWFKSSNKSPLDGYHILFSIDDGSVEISIPANGQLRYGGYTSSGSRVCNNHSVVVGGKSVNLIDGQWHLINTVFDGTGWLGYVDGEYQTKWVMTSNVRRLSGTLRIGKYTSAATYGATDAYMDDVRLYNTVLSEDDIKQLYESSWAANKQGQVFSGIVNENKSKFQITRGGVNNCNQAYESGVVPSGYLALDGIKMERVPWINTGVVFNNAHTQIMVAADVTPTATSGNNCLAGCGNSSWTGPVMLNFCGGKLEFGTNGYSTSSEAQGAYAANERLVVHAIIDYSSQKWFKNGVQIKNITSGTCPTTTAPLYIGTFKTPSSSVGNDHSFRGFIHFFEVKYGSIHKKFIPCKRLSDSVLGMYEINEGVFYSPEGGTYTAGKSTASLGRDGSLYCAEINEI